jgi:tRNA U34 5-methylaminomethyl-2-thiouridine-forming methyltransferase MnmC
MKIELIITKDGSHSLYRPDLDEQYHSVYGAIQESMHIFIRSGFEFVSKNRIQVFEMGFGTGLNALLTWMRSSEQQKKVIYYSIEKYPIEREYSDQLNYSGILMPGSPLIFQQIHESEWDKDVTLGHFTLHKFHADLAGFEIPFGNDLVYFDAFSPDKEPQLWSDEIFKNIYDSMNKGGVFVTYSAKGEVRRKLIAAGFIVEKLSGPPGKLHILRGVK